MGGLPSVKAFLRATPPEIAIHHQSLLAAGARTNSFEQVISTVCWWKRGDNGKHLVYFSLEESESRAGGAAAECCWEVQTLLLTLSSVRSLPSSLGLLLGALPSSNEVYLYLVLMSAKVLILQFWLIIIELIYKQLCVVINDTLVFTCLGLVRFFNVLESSLLCSPSCIYLNTVKTVEYYYNLKYLSCIWISFKM